MSCCFSFSLPVFSSIDFPFNKNVFMYTFPIYRLLMLIATFLFVSKWSKWEIETKRIVVSRMRKRKWKPFLSQTHERIAWCLICDLYWNFVYYEISSNCQTVVFWLTVIQLFEAFRYFVMLTLFNVNDNVSVMYTVYR